MADTGRVAALLLGVALVIAACEREPVALQSPVAGPAFDVVPGAIDVRVATGHDDAEEEQDGRMRLGGHDLDFVRERVSDATSQTVGMRFVGIDIPQGATITDAYVQFQADETSSEATALTIRGEASDDAPTFGWADGNVTSRTPTAAGVSWNPPPWSTVGEAGPAQRTPDLAAVIQEIVDRSNWTSGNALALIVTGTGRRVAESYNGLPAAAPLLHLEFEIETSGSPTDPASSTVTAAPGAVTADGTTASTITVTLLDATSAPVVGHAVSLTQGGGSATISGPSGPSDVDSRVTFTVTNTNTETVVFTATDDTDSVVLTQTAQVVFDLVPISGIDVRVATGHDDAEEEQDGSIRLGGKDLDFVRERVGDATGQTVGMRFVGIGVPQGATITDAYLQFQADETSSETTALTIRGEASDDAPTFGWADGNVTSRTPTAAGVSWNPPPWSTVGEAGPMQRTPNLAAVVQEVVDRSNWTSGNALALIITGTGRRVAESYNGLPAAAPLLHVDFRMEPSGSPTDPANSTVTAAPGAVTADGTTASTITVTLLDATSAPVVGHTVSLTQGGGSSTISGPSGPSDVDGRVTFTVTNTNTEAVTFTATDDTDSVVLTQTAEVVFDLVATSAIDVRLATGYDDAEEEQDGRMRLGGKDLDFARERAGDATGQTVGMRFVGIDIPQGATITDAYVQFQADETSSEATALTIRGEASDDAPTFGWADGNVTSRSPTAASVSWNPPPWSTVGEAGPAQRTPNLAAVIQELVDRSNWTSGNALALIITGTGRRVAESYNGLPAAAPLLHVDFRSGAPPLPVSVRPMTIDDVLYNPGMGFADSHFAYDYDYLAGSFASYGNYADPPPYPDPADYPPSNVAYFRWCWSEVEPLEGQIDFNRFDTIIENGAERSEGERLGFRIMTVSDPLDCMPDWLLSKPGYLGYDGLGRHVPDYSNPVFLAALAQLYGALGARYDGHPGMDHIDLGIVGCWGEWNSACLTDGPPLCEIMGQSDAVCLETFERVIDIMMDAFPNTPSLMLGKAFAYGDATQYAINRGAGWRVDCLGDWGMFSPTWSHHADNYPYVLNRVGDAWQRGPVHLEICWTFPHWFYQFGMSLDLVQQTFDWALDNHASLINGKSTPIPAAYWPIVTDFLKKVGYRLVIDVATHPAAADAGQDLLIETAWKNLGVAPPYLQHQVAFRLRDAAEGIVAQRESTADIRDWLPGDHDLADTMTLPAGLAPGTYSLDVAILTTEGAEPAIDLAIEGRRPDGWYELSTITVE